MIEELVGIWIDDGEQAYNENSSNMSNYPDYYDEWDSSEEVECPDCYGTGMDRDEIYDCETCYGEGYIIYLSPEDLTRRSSRVMLGS